MVLFQAELKDPHALEYGRHGQKQRGIDVLGRRNGDRDHFVGIQCRRYVEPLKKADILKDCRDALAIKAGLKEIIFATTCPSDTKATDAANEVESELRTQGHDLRVVLYSWSDLELKISQHPTALAFFFPSAVASTAVQSVRLDSDSVSAIAEAVARLQPPSQPVIPADVKAPADNSEVWIGPLEIRSMCVQDAISLLLAAQNNSQGWGFSPGRYSDATFTSYVLHGLVDAALNYSPIANSSILSATRWLRSVQASEGSWGDWHQVQRSPEATGYAVYSLVRAYDPKLEHRYARADGAVLKAVEWLIAQQQDDGGWLFNPALGAVSNNWVTFSVALGFRAFLAARKENSQYHYHRGGCSIFDVDAIPLDRPLKAGQPTGSSRSHVFSQYQTSFQDQLRDVPLVRPLDHTMFEAIDIYVKQKVPHDAIDKIINAAGKIELHQIYPTHFVQMAAERKWAITSEIEINIKPQQKRLNAVRPRFFLGKNEEQNERLWVAVTPGRHYFYHYGLMIRHVVSMRTVEWRRYVLMYRYPIAERDIVNWTGLRNIGLENEDIVLIGYVSEIERHLSELGALRPISSTETEYYVRNKFSIGSRELTTLGVKFSFWGSIAGLIAQAICAMNCQELIYIGKLGALTSPADIYNRIFSPSRYVQLRHDQVDFEEPAPPNHVLSRFMDLDSGVHISVPTVLEEDYVQRGKAEELNAKSIDNEMASIVSAISAWNRERSTKTAFTSLHFATDYIRLPNERALAVNFDLGRDKAPEAQRRKGLILKRITSEILVPYLRIPKLPR